MLREAGLPDTLFDADFEERAQAAEVRVLELRRAFAALEESEQWKDVPLPWTRQRDLPANQPVDVLQLVQGERPLWTRRLKDVNKFFRNDGGRPVTEEMRAVAASGRGPKPGTKRFARFARRGVNVELLVELGYDAYRAARTAKSH